MRMGLYVVFDRLAEESGPIFEAKTDGVALRSFKKFTATGVSSEFQLLKLGIIDHEVQKFDILDKPQEVSFEVPDAK